MFSLRKLFHKKPKKGSAKYFKNFILYGEHTDAEWFQIKKEFETFWTTATPEEKEYLETSGANDCLYQLLEYLDAPTSEENTEN